jgi:hypothetical protein
MSHALVAASPPKIIIFETGVWTHAESSSLVALLSSLSDSAVFVFWRPGATALAELWEIARVANNVHPIHENFSVTPLKDACIEVNGQVSVLERVRDKLRVSGRTSDFSPCLTAALSLTTNKTSVGQLADAVGTGMSNLRLRCRSAGLPTPVDLLGWSRSLHVVDGLAPDGGLDTDSLRSARKIGKNCSEYVRYHTGKGPYRWMECGGFDALLDAFLLELTEPRCAD